MVLEWENSPKRWLTWSGVILIFLIRCPLLIDKVLKTIAEILSAHTREADFVARYGGEEFVVLLPSTNLKDGFAIAERMRKLVEQHNFMYEGQKLPVTASIGIADYRTGVNNGTDLFKRADSAVYKSKQGGRNQVNFFKA